MLRNKPKKAASTTVVMSRMDYEIAFLVYKRFTAIGLTDEEISFLLGKRNKYVFDLLDPTEKDKFKTEQLDILPTILQCSIRDIVPNNVKHGEQIRIRGSKRVLASKIVYKHTAVYSDGTESSPFEWTKKVVKGERRKVNEAMHSAVLELVNAGYFSELRNALEIYLALKSVEGLYFTPADLQKSLAVLMNKKRQEPPVLECVNNNARYGYKSVEMLSTLNL